MRALPRPKRLFGAVALVFAIAGCSAPQLDERHVIPDENRRIAVPLRVGDVVWLTTEIKGNPVSETTAGNWLENGYPPWSETVRLPLRQVRDTLTPDEANLLIAFLATGASTISPQAAEKWLQPDKVSLWNALVDTLVLSQDQIPNQLQVRMGDVTDPNGVLTKGFCNRFAEITNGQAEMRSNFFTEECAPTAPGTRELRRILPESQLAPVTQSRANPDRSIYYLGGTVMTSVAQVERAGASMANLSEQEARWSLADWQGSGICVDQTGSPLSIVEVTLRDEPFRPLRVVQANELARYEVKDAIEAGERTVATNPGGRSETLSAASLAYLTPRDVRSLNWGRERQAASLSIFDALSPDARSACRP